MSFKLNEPLYGFHTFRFQNTQAKLIPSQETYLIHNEHKPHRHIQPSSNICSIIHDPQV